jgi:ArsR family transcriptional regulator
MDSAAVTEFFEQVACRWDAMHQDFYGTEVIDALSAHCALDAGSHVVDVGTGTGFVASGLATGVGRVTGTDSSPAMLTQARSNLDRLGIGNVTLTQAPVDRLPLDDAGADAAVANMVAHHVPDPAVMLAEMARVTRPGGTVAITDCAAHEHEWMRTEQADLWLGFTPEQIREFFTRAGLVEVGYADLGTA